MAIDEGFPRRRHRVAWLGPPLLQAAEHAFVERGLTVQQCTDQQLEDRNYLAALAGVVIMQTSAKPNKAAQAIRRHGLRLLNHDCRLLIRPSAPVRAPPMDPLPLITDAINGLRLPTAGLPRSESDKLKQWQPTGEGDPPLPHARVFEEAAAWGEVANFVAAHPAGAAPNPRLRIDGVPTLPGWQELLIQRAFWNCSEVHLSKPPEDDGRSGVAVYRAYAELEAGLLGRWPLPYFVKVGDRRRIFAEYQNYEGRVDPYVPFHLGPHLVRERCCLGAREGVIVGDYVEESESLASCAREGRAATAVACLFDRTLWGWHRDSKHEQRPLARLLRLPERVTPGRIERARQLGATRDLEALRTLLERATAVPVLVGAIHGDLHASNVRVRATDAIVIDFLASRHGPLLRDPASLEASLLVDTLVAGSEETGAWLASVSDLYTGEAFAGAPPHANPKSPASWFRACVRQVRMHARHMECQPGQYATALAVAFLWKAAKDDDAPEPEASRRAVAYLLAERVLALPIVSGEQ